MLYRQLAEESLSSYPPADDTDSTDANEGETIEMTKTKKSDPFLVGMNPKSPGGKCCWADTGGALFFDVAELQQWLQSLTKL